MSRFLGVLAAVAVFFGVGLPAAAEAQYTFQVLRSDSPRGAADSSAQRMMNEDVTRIRLAQDAYFAAYGTYASRLDDLADLKLVSGAVLTLAGATATGWQLTATHPRLVGEYQLTVKRTSPRDRRVGKATSPR